MRKNKITFLVMELLLLILALFFVWKIFNQNVPEKRVAVVLPEAGDNRWDALIKGMKQSAKNNHIHLIICNTDEMESAEVEQEIIQEQRNNQIDAFLVWPASGSETEEMLKNECADVPVILIVENVYNEDEQESSTFSEIGPDYYEMGALLARELGEDASKIGIVAGREESEASTSAVGISDTLEQMKGEIAWCYYQEEDCNVLDEIRARAPVIIWSYWIRGRSTELRAGRQWRAEEYQIFGIGYSVKSIAMLDYGKIDGLVAPDGYEIGYKSVEEMAKKLQHRFYKTKSVKTTIKMIRRDDLFQDEDIERFLYSYE
ncbi:MAG: substrate-binding domain-containing protein [Coprococcus sp.]